jgi:hypothetical protein
LRAFLGGEGGLVGAVQAVVLNLVALALQLTMSAVVWRRPCIFQRRVLGGRGDAAQGEQYGAGVREVRIMIDVPSMREYAAR